MLIPLLAALFFLSSRSSSFTDPALRQDFLSASEIQEKRDRELLAGLKGIYLEVVCVAVNGEMSDVKNAIELTLRQSSIPFKTAPELNVNDDPSLQVIVTPTVWRRMKFEVRARVEESTRLPRNHALVKFATWRSRPEGLESQDDVDTQAEIMLKVQSIMTRFCNTYLAANPR